MEYGFENGRILTPDGFADQPLGIAEGRFTDAVAGRRIDAADLWILPGLVDLHGDGFERHVAPRRGLILDLAPAMGAIEQELAGSGITTAWLAQFWSWEGGMRGPEFAARMAEAVTGQRGRTALDLRLQLRFETHMVEDGDAMLDLVREHGIDYLAFNDHLAHDRLSAGKPPPRLQGGALKARRSPEAHLKIMQACEANAPRVPAFLKDLSARLGDVVIASHDEPDGDARRAFRALGSPISEFPLSFEAAREAKDAGEAVVMGAPNVVRGGSHKSKGLSASDFVAEGLVDALASDYHYPSLAQAAFALTDRRILPMEEAWALVSTRPAAVMGLTDRGGIADGQRADFIVLDPKTRRVEATFAGGQPVHLSGKIAQRMLA